MAQAVNDAHHDQGMLVSTLSRSLSDTRSPTMVWSMSKTTSRSCARCERFCDADSRKAAASSSSSSDPSSESQRSPRSRKSWSRRLPARDLALRKDIPAARSDDARASTDTP